MIKITENNNTMDNKQIYQVVVVSVVLIIALLCITIHSLSNIKNTVEEISFGKKTTEIIAVDSSSLRDSILSYLYDTRVQHPHIVMAQAIIETGNFNSTIYKENNNLFGMKLPMVRPTVAVGVKKEYAVYSSWKESIADYIIWQSIYARNLTEEEYLNKLKSVYAEDSKYVEKIRMVISQNIRNEN